MKNALISVSDKTDLINLSNFLLQHNFNIYSTGGTYNHIKPLFEYNIHEVSDLTQFPEILNGRVKTLHPKIYAGILAKKDNILHNDDITNNNCIYFDLVVVNLYPFEKVSIEKKDALDECIENIDIGGVSLIRASSKNYENIILLTNPNQYSNFMKTYNNDTITSLDQNGSFTRNRLGNNLRLGLDYNISKTSNSQTKK